MSNRDDSPCRDCDEKELGCGDNCPKDARGEYGKKAWMKKKREIDAARREYLLQRREDFRRSEQCKYPGGGW